MTVDVSVGPSRAASPGAPRDAEPAEHADHVEFATLLQSLRETVQAGHAVPFTRQRLVDADVCLALVAHLRAALPAEIILAHTIKRQAQTLVEQARHDAQAAAAAYDATAIDDHPVVRSAMGRAAPIQAVTEQEAAALRAGATAYARACLVAVRDRLGQVAAAVEQAQATLSGSDRGDEG